MWVNMQGLYLYVEHITCSSFKNTGKWERKKRGGIEIYSCTGIFWKNYKGTEPNIMQTKYRKIKGHLAMEINHTGDIKTKWEGHEQPPSGPTNESRKRSNKQHLGFKHLQMAIKRSGTRFSFPGTSNVLLDKKIHLIMFDAN